MASTIQDSKLVVKISESVILNGKEQGGVTTKILSGINTYSKRIVTLIEDTSHSVAEFVASSLIASDLEYDSDKLQYIRMTNLDDTNKVIITYVSAAGNAALAVRAGGSTLLFSKVANGSSAGDSGLTSTSRMTNLVIRPVGGNVDVEIVIATT